MEILSDVFARRARTMVNFNLRHADVHVGERLRMNVTERIVTDSGKSLEGADRAVRPAELVRAAFQDRSLSVLRERNLGELAAS